MFRVRSQEIEEENNRLEKEKKWLNKNKDAERIAEIEAEIKANNDKIDSIKQSTEKMDEKVERMAGLIERRYGFHEKKFKNTKEIINKYGKEIFEVLDDSFAPLYGTMPFNEKLVKQTIDLFKLIIHQFCSPH